MVLWVLFRVPTTTHFNKVCCYMVLWVLFRVPTTTHFSKVCCCMVLWVLFRVPTTTHFNKVNGVVCRNTHNTIQQHILLKCVVVGTRNNNHNTVQKHISTKCVDVRSKNVTAKWYGDKLQVGDKMMAVTPDKVPDINVDTVDRACKLKVVRAPPTTRKNVLLSLLWVLETTPTTPYNNTRC